MLPKLNQFTKTVQSHIDQLPSELKEDFDTVFAGIVSMIRTYRNESGHPTGKFINREVCFVLINLFIASAKRIYALRDFYVV